MSAIQGKLKTWLKRNGFRDDRNREIRKKCSGYLRKGDRHYRIRREEHIYGETKFKLGEWVVDVSDKDFDRWANSLEETISLATFLKGE